MSKSNPPTANDPTQGDPPLLWFITVTDGTTLRTVHPPALDPSVYQRVDSAIREHLYGQPTKNATTFVVDVAAPPKGSMSPADDKLQRRQTARSQGYTGDTCTTCQGVHMKISGHCMVCEDCGNTTGCS